MICCFYPIGYWLFHPEITQMQLILKFWYLYLAAISTMLGTLYAISKRDKARKDDNIKDNPFYWDPKEGKK
jgi:hypothetical protein